jgi:histone-lysine N-methyltransferase SETD3
MKENGATFPSLTINTRQGCRQVQATRSTAPGELVLHVPRRLMITPQVAKESVIGKLIAALGSNVTDHDYMAAFLLEMKRDGGFWKPYIDMLPTDCSHIPLTFSQSEVDELRGSYIFRAIRNRRGAHGWLYDQLLSPVLKEQGFTREEFTWAKCMTTSRAYRVALGRRESLALVPLADMLEHSQKNNVLSNHEAETGFLLTARGAAEAGAPLFATYGKICNARMLNVYGGRMEQNPDNLAEIILWSLLPDHPFFRHSTRLGEHREERRAFRVRRQYHHTETRKLFSYLRLASLDITPDTERPTVALDAADKVPPLSRDNEIAALTSLAEGCQYRLQQFGTSIEEDEALLKDAVLSHNLRNIVMVRRDEKIVLHYFLGLARTALPILRDASSDVGAYAVEGRPYADYIADLARCLGSGSV